MSVLDFIREKDVANALSYAGDQFTREKDHHWYDPRWNKRLQRFRQIIEKGETDLARVIALATVGLEKEPFAEHASYAWLGKVCMDNPVTMGGQRAALHRTLLLSAMTPETDAVVELGSGDGLNLFNLWMAGAPAKARYHALEITAIGRLCTELLGQLVPRMKVSAHPYDYFKPNYDEIPGGAKHMMVFSSGSIEQCDQLPEQVITGLLDKAETITGVHTEPVSWQMPNDADPHYVETHHQRCIEFGFNQNFWPLMQDLEKRGLLEITSTMPHIFGRAKHPYALITWRKKV